MTFFSWFSSFFLIGSTRFLKYSNKDGCEFTPKTFFCHNGTPLFKVSNKGTLNMGNSKEREIRWETGFDSANGKTAQIRWNRESGIIYTHLYPNRWALVKHNPEYGQIALSENQISIDFRYIENITTLAKLQISLYFW